ncbi:MAG: hypothetical protein ACRYHQ_15785, partial [Janthinobacterium lividum]
NIPKKGGGTKNIEGAQRKSRGVVAGTPDVQIVYRGCSYWIELKSAKGVASSDQKARHAALRMAGCKVVVVRDVISAIHALSEWGVPHRILLNTLGGAIAPIVFS